MSGWKYFWQIVEPVSRERHAPRSAGFGGPPEGEAPLLAGRPYRDRRKQAARRRAARASRGRR
ncbi:hypothetical protein [Nonomuraea sp. bgisy101]|uniref:hypothetical protein n=1 Tax=Nonomuraea sp. bgisy101 TaxID=3413784 RepID=UPI003D71B357